MRLTIFHWASALVISFLIHLAVFYFLIKSTDSDGAKAQGVGGFEVALSLQSAVAGSDHTSDEDVAPQKGPEENTEDLKVEDVDVDEVEPEVTPDTELAIDEPSLDELEVETAHDTVPEIPAEPEPEPTEVAEPEENQHELIESEVVIPVVETSEMEETVQLPVPRPKLKPVKIEVIEKPKALSKQTQPSKLAPKLKEKISQLVETAQPEQTLPATVMPKQSMPKTQVSQGRGATGEVADRSDETASAGGGEIVGTASPTYVTRIREWLERHKTYPKKAKRRRHQGVVLLAFSINRDGKVLAYEIEKVSGFESLDKATIKMLLSADPLPRFPDDMKGEILEFVLPVSFSLSN